MGGLVWDEAEAAGSFEAGERERLNGMVRAVHESLHDGTCAGNDALGWLDLPGRLLGSKAGSKELAEIKSAAGQLQERANVLVVIGIGGSYVGARTIVDALRPSYSERVTPTGMKIIYAGHHLDGAFYADLLERLESESFAVNVISKSGTTTEPAIAFRLLRDLLERRYGKLEANKRIVVTTDASQGALRELAIAEGYAKLVIPRDIGGRYSVLSAVGLLPAACAGVDLAALLQGADDANQLYREADPEQNDCLRYAVSRQLLLRRGKTTELFVTWQEPLATAAEWWKQLFGESEGKDGKGLYPASVKFSTDLHSMGQWIQEGPRSIFATHVTFAKARRDVQIPDFPGATDGLDPLVGKSLHEVNELAAAGTRLAHADGGVPTFRLTLQQPNAESVGAMFSFFMKACAVSALLSGVQPFDQPGVEAYKRNMFALLGKPGYEVQKAELLRRLKAGM